MVPARFASLSQNEPPNGSGDVAAAAAGGGYAAGDSSYGAPGASYGDVYVCKGDY